MSKHGTNLEPISNENLVEIQYQIGRAFRRMPNKRAEALLGDKKNLQKLLQKISKELELPLVNENAILQIPKLVMFYREILDLDKPEIAELDFPEHEIMQTFKAIDSSLAYSHISEAYAKKWKINNYHYMDPDKQIEPATALQKRPSGLYVIGHRAGDEPDKEYLGKSYEEAVAAGMKFMNWREYMLATGFHRFRKGYFMDRKGWTRTSDLWSEGRLVIGCWCDALSELELGYGARGDRNPDRGPRELVYS